LSGKLSAFPGDVVTLVGAKFAPTVGAFVPRYHRYEVTGLFDTGMYEYDNSYVAMPRAQAQKFAALDSAVTGIEVRLDDPGRRGRSAGSSRRSWGTPTARSTGSPRTHRSSPP